MGDLCPFCPTPKGLLGQKEGLLGQLSHQKPLKKSPVMIQRCFSRFLKTIFLCYEFYDEFQLCMEHGSAISTF